MNNSNQTAFPLDARRGDIPGLTKREIFAKDAPDMPEWFQCESVLIKPQPPKDWTQLNFTSEADKEDVKNWHRDQSYDLPDHLQWYQKDWEKYSSDIKGYEYLVRIEKYFAWRLYFADEMLRHLEEG